MLNNIKYSESNEYRAGLDFEPINFFIDTIPESKSLDILLGYFSSSAIHILSLSFARFIVNGGKARFIINHFLSKKDKEAISNGLKISNDGLSLSIDDLKSLKGNLDDYGKHFFECFAYLIAKERISFKIIKPYNKGISHFKSGVLTDFAGNKVKFRGSNNFTSMALLHNFEELEIKKSWESVANVKAIQEYEEYFENIFSGNADFAEYLDISEVTEVILNTFGDKEIDELLVDERELIIKKKDKISSNKRLRKSLEVIEDKIEEIISLPRFPYPQGPREYQKEAYDNWIDNNYQGIFAMATGTGKTITSLNCLLQESILHQDKVYHALILVPTITLVNQWEEEAKQFNFRETIKVSSKASWEKELATVLSTSKRLPTSFIVIATYASFVKDRFNKYLKDFPSDTVFIADEAHNIGSQSVLSKLTSIHFQKRIGLSATPKRVYDPEGTNAMAEFFNDQEPFTYSFSMERAINEGILCKYYYHPHIVRLTKDEMERYIEISKKLAKFYNFKNDGLEPNDIVEKLLLQRKRIIHKAENKLALTIDILKDRFNKEKNLKYTFIYVPEGSTEYILESDSESEEDIKIIDLYTREIARIDQSLMVNQFISGLTDRNEILNQFRDGKIHVVASMKCLDEGVDIPRAEHAVFCSSTGNPRQFIQRRGRILRKHKDKSVAVIHDLVVIPDSITEATSDTFSVERSLVKKELERVMYFASLALNPFETEETFAEICEFYDLNIYTIFDEIKA
jgi:superfamily II DNA or RNA helicase